MGEASVSFGFFESPFEEGKTQWHEKQGEEKKEGGFSPELAESESFVDSEFNSPDAISDRQDF